MPDGYGNDLPSWAIAAPRSSFDGEFADLRWIIAMHLRLDHGYSLHKIAKVTGLRYREVRDYMQGELGG